MASIRKKGNKWLAEVRIRKTYQAKTFATKIEAQGWAVEQERRLGKHRGEPIKKTLRQAMERYAQEVAPGHKGYRWELVRLKKFENLDIADTMLSSLDTHDLQEWVNNSGLTAGSIRREFSLMRSVLTTARKKWQWMEQDIARDVELPKPPRPRDKRISNADLGKITLALGYEGQVITTRHQVAVAALLALETAMRQGEIFGLEWERIFLAERYVRLIDTKNGDVRDVPLSTRAVALLESMPTRKGRVFTVPQETAQQFFRRACQIAEIEGFRFHDLRHEALTRLARKLNMLELSRMVGHRDPRSLTIYYNATATELAARLD